MIHTYLLYYSNDYGQRRGNPWDVLVVRFPRWLEESSRFSTERSKFLREEALIQGHKDVGFIVFEETSVKQVRRMANTLHARSVKVRDLADKMSAETLKFLVEK